MEDKNLALIQKDMESVCKRLDKSVEVLEGMRVDIHSIDTNVKVSMQRIERNADDIKILNTKSNVIDAMVALGAIVIGTISALFGGKP